MPVRCPTCGTSNQDANNFCVACGRSLTDQMRGPPPVPGQPSAEVQCGSCRTTNVATNVFCVQCGKLLKPLGPTAAGSNATYVPQPPLGTPAPYGTQQPSYVPKPEPWMIGPGGLPQQKTRPLGVTILAILDGIGGGLLVFAGLVFLVLGAAAERLLGPDADPALFQTIGGALGVVFLLLGLAYAALGWGLWKGKGWAWIATIGFQAIGVLYNLVTIRASGGAAIFGLILNGVIIWYFLRPHVKYYFGQGPPPATQPTFVAGPQQPPRF